MKKYFYYICFLTLGCGSEELKPEFTNGYEGDYRFTIKRTFTDPFGPPPTTTSSTYETVGTIEATHADTLVVLTNSLDAFRVHINESKVILGDFQTLKGSIKIRHIIDGNFDATEKIVNMQYLYLPLNGQSSTKYLITGEKIE